MRTEGSREDAAPCGRAEKDDGALRARSALSLPSASAKRSASPRDFIVTAARSCIGTPYRHLGRDPARGLDCVGLVLHAYRAAGLLADVVVTGYGRRPEGHALIAEVMRHGRRVPLAEARPADVLAFAGVERLPCHLALVTETSPRLLIVHAWAERRAVAEHALAGFRGGAPVAVFRHAELARGPGCAEAKPPRLRPGEDAEDAEKQGFSRAQRAVHFLRAPVGPASPREAD
jgi:hypothetical protein